MGWWQRGGPGKRAVQDCSCFPFTHHRWCRALGSANAVATVPDILLRNPPTHKGTCTTWCFYCLLNKPFVLRLMAKELRTFQLQQDYPRTLTCVLKLEALSWLLFSSLSFFFFFSFKLLFDFCTIELKMHSTSLNLSARKGPEKTVRHWKEPHSFKLQVGGMTEWSLEIPSHCCFCHSRLQLLRKCTEIC